MHVCQRPTLSQGFQQPASWPMMTSRMCSTATWLSSSWHTSHQPVAACPHQHMVIKCLSRPGGPGSIGVASVPVPPAPLDSSHLELHLVQHSLFDAKIVPRHTRQLTDANVIKSMLIMVQNKPWIAVLRGSDKLDMKRLAAHVGVPKSKVRLATHQETVSACGFVPGTVPPLGHCRPLTTIVDAAVACIKGPVYGGGGDPDLTLAISVTSLVTHTNAQVLSIALSPGSTPSWSSSSQSLSSSSDDERTPSPDRSPTPSQDSSTSSASDLPLPWAPGSEMVELTGIVAVRRKIAKLLLFAMVLPENLPPLPAGQSVYLRRLWANPGQVQAQADGQGAGSQPARVETAEVQLIMGKTLERNMGREAAMQLLDSIKPGVCVRVVGRVQPHGAGARRPAAPASPATSAPAMWDVVCHQVEVLPKRRVVLDPHPDALAAVYNPTIPTHIPVAAHKPNRDASQGPTAPDGDRVWTPDGIDPAQDIVWVSDVQGLMLVEQALADQVAQWQQQLQQLPDYSPSAGDDRVLQLLPPPVAVDCEWEPYDRGARPNPVALMQVAIRGKAFLVDTLTLGRGLAPHNKSRHHEMVLSSGQQHLGALIQRIFVGQGMNLLGFQLGHDIRRLVDSYPWLLKYLQPQSHALTGDPAAESDAALLKAALGCLQSSTTVSKVNGISYVDMLKLARATHPERFMMSFGRPHQQSLSSCVKEMFGSPLDKVCQRSNWAARPLTADQIKYAAADALSLIALHDKLISTSVLIRSAP